MHQHQIHQKTSRVCESMAISWSKKTKNNTMKTETNVAAAEELKAM
jgi:hypothetical protein